MNNLSSIEKKIQVSNKINKLLTEIFHQVTVNLEFNDFDIELQQSILLLLNWLLVEKSFHLDTINRVEEFETYILYLTTGKSSTSQHEARIISYLTKSINSVCGGVK